MKTIYINVTTTHAVRAKRFFYGSKPKHSIAFVGTRKECSDYIKKSNSRNYFLQHNEYSLPQLRIVLTKNLSKHLAWELNKIR
jgi:hypothetical protein